MEIVTIIAFALGILVGWLIKPKADVSALKENASRMQADNALLISENKKLISETAALSALNRELPKTIELLSNRALAETGEQQAKKFEGMMRPFREQMEKIEKSQTENKTSFEEQVKNLISMSGNLQKEAADLTRALRGDKKAIGGLGERAIRIIFEANGLESPRDYTSQEYFQDDEQKRFTDYVVRLPAGRNIIIDSKNMLPSYYDFIHSDTDEKEKIHLAKFISATKDRIKELAGKEYQKLVGGTNLDFVFMFIPLEQAYLDALRADPELDSFAYSKNVIMATPSMLMPMMRMVGNLWNIEKQNKDIDKAVSMLAGLYEKYAGFMSDYQMIGKQIKTLSGSYENGLKKAEGRGGLSAKFDDMRKIGGLPVTKRLAVSENGEASGGGDDE